LIIVVSPPISNRVGKRKTTSRPESDVQYAEAQSIIIEVAVKALSGELAGCEKADRIGI
jgi:hypothetical protein